MDFEKPSLPRVDSPSFVWDTITQMHADGIVPGRRVEDHLIRTGCNFLKRMKNGRNHHLALLSDYHDFYTAWSLHLNDLSVKWLIQAGALTNIPLTELAAYIGQPVVVVETYLQLFFNVRPRLSARGYIFNEIMMPAVRHGLTDHDFDYQYKIVAFSAGWEIFTTFYEFKEMDPKAEHWLHTTFRTQLKKLGWKAASRVEVNQYNAVEIIEQCLKLEEIEKSQGAAPAQAEASVLIKSLLTQCSMTIVSSEKALDRDEPRVTDEMGTGRLKYGDPIPKLEGATNG